MNETAGAMQQASLYALDFKDEGGVLAFIDAALDARRRLARPHDLEAIHNIAWYVGNQELAITKRGLSRLPNRGNRVRLIYNQILPLIEIGIARMGFEPITYDVLPDGDGNDAQRLASLRTAVLRGYADERLDLPTLDESVNLWAACTGDAFVKVTWDPYAGDDLDVLKDLGMEESEFRSTFKADPDLKAGDVCVSIVPGFNLFWGPEGVEFEDAEWIIEVNERTKSYLQARYDLDDDELDELQSGSEDPYLIHRLENISATGEVAVHEPDPDTIVTSELWVRACKQHPKGRNVIAAGKKIIRNQENPYDDRRPRYERLKFRIVPGKPRGLSQVTNLRGPQSDLNRNMSQQVENRELMANPFILARRNSIVNEAEWNSAPGGIRHYNGDVPPHIQPGMGMPSSALNILQKTQGFMQDLTGAHDVSQAKAPANVKSGIALSTLREADEARLSAFGRRRRRFWERVGELILLTLEQFATEDRYVQVLGEERRWEVVAFSGEKLRGEQQKPGLRSYRVRVKTNGMPKSRVAQTELINGLLERGVFQLPPEQQRVIFEMLDIGDIGGDIDPRRKDKQRARLENEMMRGGQYAQVRQFDDDETHQHEHKQFMRSEEFRKLDQQTQTLFEAHDLEHDKNKIKRAFKARLLVQQVAGEFGLLGPAGPQGALPQPSSGPPQNGNGRLPVEMAAPSAP